MLTFPTHLFRPARIAMRRGGVTITGGESLVGVTDTIRTDGGGYWLIQMAGIELTSPDLIRAWRAWEDHLDGGVTQVLVPVADVRQAPRPVIGGKLSRPSALHAQSDDPYFPEAVGFASPWIVANIVGDFELRATTITIDVTRGARLKGGEVFALDHETAGRRVYRVSRVLGRDGQQATVQIRSPLREAVTDGMACDFDWPSVPCTALPEAETFPDIEQGTYASVNIAFREAFTP